MAYENFSTGWTETDPNSHLSQTSTRSTFAGITFTEDCYLTKTAGVNYTGNFDIAFDFFINSTSTNMSPEFYGPNIVDLRDTGSGYSQNIQLYDYDGTKAGIKLQAIELTGFTSNEDYDNATLNVNTVYYGRYKRNESVGTNGTLYFDVYGSDANRQTETSPLVQLAVTLTVMGKIDMTVMYSPLTYNGADAKSYTGYLENLDLYYKSSPTGQNSVLDTFDRADENPITGNWGDSGIGTFQIISNQCAPTSLNDVMYWEDYWGDSEGYLTIAVKSTGNNSPGIYIRVVDETYYKINVNPVANTIDLQMYDGSFHQLGTVNQTITNGDSVGWSANGSALKVYYKVGAGDWTPIIEATDTSYTFGLTSIQLYNDTAQRIDNYGGGPINMPSVFPSNGVLETFSDTEGPPMTGWGDSIGGIKSNGTQGLADAAGNNISYMTTSYGPNSVAYTTVAAAEYLEGIVARYDSATVSGYGILTSHSDNVLSIIRLTAGDAETLSSVEQAVSAGDAIGITVIDNLIVGWYKASGGSWVPKLLAREGTYAGANKLGAVIVNTGAGTARIDNFGGGTVVGVILTGVTYMES